MTRKPGVHPETRAVPPNATSDRRHYIVVTANSLGDLIERINRAIDQGYHLYNGMIIDTIDPETTTYMQAMILRGQSGRTRDTL